MSVQKTEVKGRQTGTEADPAATAGGRHARPTAAEIEAWLVSYMAQLLAIDPGEVRVTTTFNRYGVDSSAAIGLTGDLGDWLGVGLEPSLLRSYPTIQSLTRYLADEVVPADGGRR